jgi:succinate-semialdehyde dehydrogenase/glutarate-semialdehyde dehydrogenase
MDTTALLKTVHTGLWIGGEEREAKSTFNVLDPSDDQVLTAVADATADDAIAALDAACAVQAEWAATAPRERGEILRAVFEKITERAEDIATLMTLEMGKVVAESMGEVKYGAEFFRCFAEEAVRIGGRFTPSPAGTGRIIVTKQAVGPCYAITPWNFPLAMGTRRSGRRGGRAARYRQAGAGDAAVDAAVAKLMDSPASPGRAVGAADQ